MSQSPSPHNSSSSYSPRNYSYSYSSRSSSPVRKTLKGQFKSIFSNDLYFKIAIAIFIFLTCISLSFYFPENDPNTVPYPKSLKELKDSMQLFTQILCYISFAYLITAFIVRRKSN